MAVALFLLLALLLLLLPRWVLGLGLQVEQHQQLLAGQRARLSAHLAELSALTGLEVLAVEVAPLSQSIRRGGAEVRPAVVSALETEARAEAARKDCTAGWCPPDAYLFSEE